jgi:hypothetical protein
MTNELKRLRKETFIVKFEVVYRNLPGGTEKTTTNLNKSSRAPERDLNTLPPEYEAGLLIFVQVIKAVKLKACMQRDMVQLPVGSLALLTEVLLGHFKRMLRHCRFHKIPYS